MHRNLTLYLKGKKNTSVLLIGQRGLALLSDAYEVAAGLLDCPVDRLSEHPDYLFINRGAEKSLGVEVVDTIQEKVSVMPCISKKFVIIIDEFNLMTVQGQNQLLKLIEENDNCLLVMTAYRDTVLETIKSRTFNVYYKPLSYDEFLRYTNKEANQESQIAYAICGGCPLLLSDDTYKDAFNAFSMVHDILVSQTDIYKLMDALGLVTEKANSFYTDYPELSYNLFSMIGRLLGDYSIQKRISCTEVLSTALNECDSVFYTKDNFFMDIVEIISSLE